MIYSILAAANTTNASPVPPPEVVVPPSYPERLIQGSPSVVLISLGIIVGIVFLVYRSRNPSVNVPDDQFRHTVAKTVLFSAVWGVVVLGVVTIIKPSSSATQTMNMLLPLFGTWVGTLLAFYFGKENYESGARNSERLARILTPTEKLRSIGVITVMIKKADFKIPPPLVGKQPADFATILLKDIQGQMTEQRLPLISLATGEALAIIHKSLIDAFLVKAQSAGTFATATLQNLLDDPIDGKTAKTTFALVTNTATLADVKDAATNQSRTAGGLACEDVFVTSANSKIVEGWITSDIIDKNSVV